MWETISLWDKDASKISGQKLLSEMISSADFVFLCIPSWAMREAVTSIAPYLDGGAGRSFEKYLCYGHGYFLCFGVAGLGDLIALLKNK